MRLCVALSAVLLSCLAAEAAPCVASPPPASWSSAQPATPVALPTNPKSIGPLTLIMVRHAEKPMNSDGLMIEDGNLSAVGVRRAQRLPERLKALYGCPDMIISTNPAVKILNRATGQHFNYVRPLTTIAPYSGILQFPVWTPYGYDQTEKLVQDLFGDKAFAPKADGAPKKILIAWEHSNVMKMTAEIFKDGRFTPMRGTMRNGGRTWTCQTPPVWPECDFDSIWIVNIKDGQACFTQQYEKLNTPSFQKACKGDLR